MEELAARTEADSGDLVELNAQFMNIGSELPQNLPRKVRKDTASYYTSPWAAELLSRLATPEITGGELTILDPACGAGILLLTALQQITEQELQAARIKIIGSDLNPLSARVARLTLESYARNVHARNPNISIDIAEGDALDPSKIPQEPFCDHVIMNPPFSSAMRVRGRQKQALKGWAGAAGVTPFVDARMGLHFYFLFLVDLFLKEGGLLALVIPSTTFAGKAARFLLRYFRSQNYHFECLVETNSPKGAFSADCNWKEYLAILKKGGPENPNTRLVQFVQDLPREAVKSVAAQILQGEEDLQVGGVQIGKSKLIPAENIFEGQVGGEFLFFRGDWTPLTSHFNNSALVPLGKSVEIRVFRGFDATYSRFLIL
ncbi:MAG TPA: N-6 DNA methylase, partial [Candidatus Lokiarchaeia archaeon]|nr:N-6 DNA methylase [Candidatus Lokiarchaeia archaeon]